tara:strand:+ start:431 stop:829 length:399 start_codon:yes stop_codon:yes gene_type:complete
LIFGNAKEKAKKDTEKIKEKKCLINKNIKLYRFKTMSDEQKDQNDKDNVDILSENIVNSNSTFNLALLYITKEGEVVVMTSGEMSKTQEKTLDKIFTVIGDHSLVFKIILSLEILFEKITNRISYWFKSKIS